MLNAGRTQQDVIPSEAEESISQAEALKVRIESLMARRASTYERTAHIIIDTDSHTIDSLAEELSKIIQK
jgi:shikimate kinase